jgi:hypothetical protein
LDVRSAWRRFTDNDDEASLALAKIARHRQPKMGDAPVGQPQHCLRQPFDPNFDPNRNPKHTCSDADAARCVV